KAEPETGVGLCREVEGAVGSDADAGIAVATGWPQARQRADEGAEGSAKPVIASPAGAARRRVRGIRARRKGRAVQVGVVSGAAGSGWEDRSGVLPVVV